jgi:G3E family GTPase
MLRHHFRLGVIVTVVDAFNAALHERLHPEWTAQVTAADRLVLTKTDLITDQACEALQKHLERINPAALILIGSEVKPQDPLLLTGGLHDSGPEKEAERWMQNLRSRTQDESDNRGAPSDHEHSTHSQINSFCLVFDHQINWTAFGLWLSMLLNRHGQNVLRVKGILNIAGADYPVAIHGVQHLVHPPVHLPRWPDTDRQSRIVFIVDGLDQEAVEESFRTCCEYLK